MLTALANTKENGQRLIVVLGFIDIAQLRGQRALSIDLAKFFPKLGKADITLLFRPNEVEFAKEILPYVLEKPKQEEAPCDPPNSQTPTT